MFIYSSHSILRDKWGRSMAIERLAQYQQILRSKPSHAECLLGEWASYITPSHADCLLGEWASYITPSHADCLLGEWASYITPSHADCLLGEWCPLITPSYADCLLGEWCPLITLSHADCLLGEWCPLITLTFFQCRHASGLGGSLNGMTSMELFSPASALLESYPTLPILEPSYFSCRSLTIYKLNSKTIPIIYV